MTGQLYTATLLFGIMELSFKLGLKILLLGILNLAYVIPTSGVL